MLPENRAQFATIPMKHVGPVTIHTQGENWTVPLPLATFETPLWPSVERGAALCTRAGGIYATLVMQQMSRSILLEANSAAEANHAWQDIQKRMPELQRCASASSRFTTLIGCHAQIVGGLFYLRLAFETGDAAGHNMVTLAAERIQTWILKQYLALRYISISGNYCVDKKNSAINGILGRGKYVIAEVWIPKKLCERYLKTTPQKIVELNIKKNLIGSILSGSVRSANAHFANMLLAFYLATGQDAANIIEGSQGMVYAEVREEQLYFSVTLPNIIVGSVGNGKLLDFVQDNLRALGCLEVANIGDNAKRLAIIAASTVLCGELSLLAAQTNPGELMATHIQFERQISS